MNFIFRRPIFSTAFFFSIILVIWIVFAPAQVGGGAIYVMVNGNSMEPKLKKGDLVILHPSKYYDIGDVVTYQYPDIGPVIHRIIGKEGDRFIIQGDNNTWVDAFQPAQSDLLGKMWLFIPMAGIAAQKMHSPWAMALAASIGVFLLGSVFMENSSTDQKPELKNQIQSFLSPFGAFLAKGQEGYFLVIYAVGILSIVLGIFAFTQPVERQVPDDISYVQSGFYTYFASLPDGVYDNNRLESGDAIFPQLNCNVNLIFDYNLVSTAPVAGGGTYRLSAEIESNSGWHRTIELKPESRFEGSSFHTEQIIDTCQVQSIVDQVQSTTGIQRQQYLLNIAPHVQFAGSIANRKLEDQFSPVLSFVVEPQQIYLAGSNNGNQNPLQPSTSSFAPGKRMEANTLPIFSLPLPVITARWISAIGILLTMAGLGASMLLYQQAEVKDEKLLGQLVLGNRLIEAKSGSLDKSGPVIDISNLDEMARLAEKLGVMVFYQEHPIYIEYQMRSEGVTYRFRKMNSEIKELAPLNGIAILPGELQNAVRQGQFTLYFQPSVDLTSGLIKQLEVLLRWEHPILGLLNPVEFLPLANQSGMAKEIDVWVVSQSCLHLSEWRASGYEVPQLVINLSSQSLEDERLAEIFENALAEYALPGNLLQIDLQEDGEGLTETAQRGLQKLKSLGVRLTLSRSAGMQFDPIHYPVEINQVKISRSMLRQTISDEEIGSEMQRWISSVHEQNISVSAVGVETRDQLNYVRQMGYDDSQGFVISPPLPVSHLEQYMRRTSKLIDLDLNVKE